MADLLSDEIRSVQQRTGTNTGKLRSERDRAAFSSNVRADLANLIYQVNTVYKTLADTLSSTTDLNALDFGLSGNVIFSHITATAASATAYWSSTNARPLTIKETFDVLLVEIARLENQIESYTSPSSYDDTALRTLISTNSLDLEQLAQDSMGQNYTLDGDGLPNLTYSLSQALDSIGALFTGFPGTGNTYTSTYPTLSFSVLLSNVTIDTTLAQSVITGLTADLAAIQAFTGMDSSTDSTPDYSAHGALSILVDGQSLEQGMQALDAAIGGAHAVNHISGGTDEIDGDQLDIDWTPTNYTPDTTPAEVSSANHLTAHLAGIDAAIVASAAATLQTAYDTGAAGTSQDIQLLNSQGPLRVLDDNATPLNILLQGATGAGASVFNLRTDFAEWLGIHQAFGAVGAHPVVTATQGKLYSYPDAVSADTEMWWRNDDATDAEAQVTRDGIVKELEVGSETIHASAMRSPTTNGAPDADVEYPTMVYAMKMFDPNTTQTTYATCGIPQDEDGNFPTRFRVSAHLGLLPNAGPYPGGAGFTMDLAYSDGGAISVQTSDNFLSPGWSAADTAGKTGLSAASVDTQQSLDFGLKTLGVATASSGLMHFQVQRNVNDATDDWDDDVGLIALHVTWYR